MPWITTKSDDSTATGRHGIGLMTLRSLSSSLQVHCAPYHVQLDESVLSAVNAAQPPSWLAEEGWTVLHVPLARKVLNLESLHAWIKGWGHAGLLFLRSVTRVSLHDGTGAGVRDIGDLLHVSHFKSGVRAGRLRSAPSLQSVLHAEGGRFPTSERRSSMDE